MNFKSRGRSEAWKLTPVINEHPEAPVQGSPGKLLSLGSAVCPGEGVSLKLRPSGNGALFLCAGNKKDPRGIREPSSF